MFWKKIWSYTKKNQSSVCCLDKMSNMIGILCEYFKYCIVCRRIPHTNSSIRQRETYNGSFDGDDSVGHILFKSITSTINCHGYNVNWQQTIW